MNKSALQNMQQVLNVILSEFERVNDKTNWAVLEFMLGASSSVVPVAKKIGKPENKKFTLTIAAPKTKIVKQEPQQQTATKDMERTDFTAIRPQPPLTIQQDDREKCFEHSQK